jgi:hypothetical protein
VGIRGQEGSHIVGCRQAARDKKSKNQKGRKEREASAEEQQGRLKYGLGVLEGAESVSSSGLQLVKDDLKLKTWVYCIPCECSLDTQALNSL